MTDIRHALATETDTARTLLRQYVDEIEDDDEARRTLVEGETSLREEVERAVARLSDLATLTAALKLQEVDAKARRDRFEKQAVAIRTALAVALEAMGEKRLELPAATLTLKAVPASAIITDEALIPSAYQRAEIKTDKRAILAALKDGKVVPGATMSNGSATVQIRRG